MERKGGGGRGVEKGNVTLKSPLQGTRLAETYIPHSQLISVFSPLPSSPLQKKTGIYVFNVFGVGEKPRRGDGIYLQDSID